MIKRYTGNCYVCKEATEIRNIDIYVIGSEGLNICHPCEMQMVEWLRVAANEGAEAHKQKWLEANRKCPHCKEKVIPANGMSLVAGPWFCEKCDRLWCVL